MVYNKDRLDTAYANVALIADGAWSVPNDYVRANQVLSLLHVRNCALRARLGVRTRFSVMKCQLCQKFQELLLYECRFKTRMGLQRSVLDTIPESRLAQYGVYFYDEMRESCYTTDHPTAFKIDVFSKEEAWMTEEVDRIFQLMNNPNSK